MVVVSGAGTRIGGRWPIGWPVTAFTCSPWDGGPGRWTGSPGNRGPQLDVAGCRMRAPGQAACLQQAWLACLGPVRA